MLLTILFIFVVFKTAIYGWIWTLAKIVSSKNDLFELYISDANAWAISNICILIYSTVIYLLNLYSSDPEFNKNSLIILGLAAYSALCLSSCIEMILTIKRNNKKKD